MVELVAALVVKLLLHTKLYNPVALFTVAVAEPLLLQRGSTVVISNTGVGLTVTVKLITVGQATNSPEAEGVLE